MKTIHFLLATGAIILCSAFSISSSMNWTIKEGYSIKFAGTDAEGVFQSLKGDINFDESQPENSKFNFTVEVNSINTGNGMKNKHAIGKKWFNAEQFPDITFKSSSVSKKGSDYNVTGDMQIHGVTKNMTIPFQFSNDIFTSNFSVKRMDFGVGTMKGMSKKVSDEIKLEVSIPVSK